MAHRRQPVASDDDAFGVLETHDRRSVWNRGGVEAPCQVAPVQTQVVEVDRQEFRKTRSLIVSSELQRAPSINLAVALPVWQLPYVLGNCNAYVASNDSIYIASNQIYAFEADTGKIEWKINASGTDTPRTRITVVTNIGNPNPSPCITLPLVKANDIRGYIKTINLK